MNTRGNDPHTSVNCPWLLAPGNISIINVNCPESGKILREQYDIAQSLKKHLPGRASNELLSLCFCPFSIASNHNEVKVVSWVFIDVCYECLGRCLRQWKLDVSDTADFRHLLLDLFSHVLLVG